MQFTPPSGNNVTKKEIAPGIMMYKQVIHPVKVDMDIINLYTVCLNRLNNIEFIADFNGSENIILEGENKVDKTVISHIQPFTSQLVAKLILKKDWKLKSKFRFTMRPSKIDVQQKYIGKYINEMSRKIEEAKQVYKNFCYSTRDFMDVLQFLAEKDIEFIDIEFPPYDLSIFGHFLDGGGFDTLIQWRKPDEFFYVKDVQKNFEIFYEKIEPNDIKQGALGNCWFLSALSAIAERPSLIRRLFITAQVNDFGIYKMRLCKNGEWVEVTVDSYFPCYPLSTPIFSSAHGNELWVLLLEKAYAKLNGSYFSLRNGYPHEAFTDLTGCPTETFYFDDLKLSQQSLKVFWQRLQHFEEEGYVITAFTSGQDILSEGNRIKGQNRGGLVAGHAYALLQVKEAYQYQLLQIRNPWGDFEWRGDWGDESPLWTQQMIDELHPTFDINDGTFWMSFKDFLQNFIGITVCKVRNWEEVRTKGKFIKVYDSEDPDNQVVISKWYYQLDVKQKQKVVLGLHQEDQRCEIVKQLRGYLDIGLSVFQRDNIGNIRLIKMTHTQFEREIELELVLDEGTYFIVPRTSGLNLRRPKDFQQQQIRLINEEGQLHPIVKSVLDDIFRKFDLLMSKKLTYLEFKGFFDCLGKELDPIFFKNQILEKYASLDNGITKIGFLDFFKDNIVILGEEQIFKWFNLLGYDKDFYSFQSRVFILSLHTSQETGLIMKSSIETDLNNRAHIQSIQKDEFCIIEELQSDYKGVRTLSCYNRIADIFTIISINDLAYPVQLIVDASQTTSAIFSSNSGIVKKNIEPGQMELIMHLKPDNQSNLKFKPRFKILFNQKNYKKQV